MSRIFIGIALLCVAATCSAQIGRAPDLPAGPGTDADIRAKNPDPSAVEIPLYAGALISDVLKALTDKGFLIKWNPEQVLPTRALGYARRPQPHGRRIPGQNAEEEKEQRLTI
jgi:hypothetical protein